MTLPSVSVETDYAHLVVPPGLGTVLLRILDQHRGREQAIGRGELLQLVEQAASARIDDRVVRFAIHALRRKGYLILSAPGRSGGYWRAVNLIEVIEFSDRELHPKAIDLLETEKAMKEAARRQFGGQEGML